MSFTASEFYIRFILLGNGREKITSNKMKVIDMWEQTSIK